MHRSDFKLYIEHKIMMFLDFITCSFLLHMHVLVNGEGRPRSARFRPSATNQRPPIPPTVSPEMKRRRDNSISQMREVQCFAGTMSATCRREKIVFKRLALPPETVQLVHVDSRSSPHVQGRSSSQGVVSPQIWTM